MTTFRHILIAVIVVAGAMPVMAQGPPSYLIVRTPANAIPPGHHHVHGYVPPRGQAVTVHRPTYAYGWFGAAPRRHWSRHTGYYGNYTQWSAR